MRQELTQERRFSCSIWFDTDISEDYIQRKCHGLNLRHRKRLCYDTPYGVYFSKVLHLAC